MNVLSKPCTKAKFATEEYANLHIQKSLKTSSRKVVPCRSYFCPHCSTWHITSGTGSVDVQKMQELRNEILSLKKQIRDMEIKHKNEDNAKFRENEMVQFLTKTNQKVLKDNKEKQDTISRILAEKNQVELELKKYKEKYGNQ